MSSCKSNRDSERPREQVPQQQLAGQEEDNVEAEGMTDRQTGIHAEPVI